MLRITVERTEESLRLSLEGKLAGAWVEELEESWRTQAVNLGERSLWVDLTGVVCIDAAGKYLLALMHRAGVRFVAPGCATSALVREITGDWPVGVRSKERRGSL
jgi:anti-anti-sigma regulatory factor